MTRMPPGEPSDIQESDDHPDGEFRQTVSFNRSSMLLVSTPGDEIIFAGWFLPTPGSA